MANPALPTPDMDRVAGLESSLNRIVADLSGLTQVVQRLAGAVPVASPQGGILTPKENGRVELKGTCNRSSTLISQTNDQGTTETIRYITNTGSCGNVTIRCLDDLNRELGGTAATLGPKQTIRSYTSPGGASKIVFSCDGHDAKGECKIEFDR